MCFQTLHYSTRRTETYLTMNSARGGHLSSSLFTRRPPPPTPRTNGLRKRRSSVNLFCAHFGQGSAERRSGLNLFCAHFGQGSTGGVDNVHYSWDVRCFLEGSFAKTILRPVDALDRPNFQKVIELPLH